MAFKMANFPASGSTGKQVIISLRGLSHEVCVAATQTAYWEQVDLKNKNKSIYVKFSIVNKKFKYFNHK
jgi:hypothetical protein